MKIAVFNKTDVNTKICFPLVLSCEIEAGGSYEFEDVVQKQKVPTAQGEQEIDVVFPALQLAKDAVLAYGRKGLEFTHDGYKYSFGKKEKVAMTDKEVVRAVGILDPFGKVGSN